MKRLLVGLGVLALACAASAQNILTSVFTQGGVTAQTVSGHDVWATGGSPKTGIYHYWKPVTLQATASSNPFDLNGPVQVALSKGTYYAPGYSAAATEAATLVNGPAAAIFKLSARVTAGKLPVLPIHEWVDTTAAATARLYFSVPNDTNVSIATRSGTHLTWNFYALSGEIGPSDSGLPGTYTVLGGGTYCIWFNLGIAGSSIAAVGDELAAEVSFSLPN